jgi:hypothetical protein
LEFKLTEEEMEILNEVSSCSIKTIFPNDICKSDIRNYWPKIWGEKKFELKK